MKVYKISSFWKYLFLTTYLLIYLLIGYFVVLPIYDNSELHQIIAFLLPLTYLCGAIFIYSYINGQSNLIIVIDEEKIRQENDNIYKEWFFEEIKGYRILPYSIILETNNLEMKKLNISYNYENFEELKKWIELRFKNLDKKDLKNELKQIKEKLIDQSDFTKAKKTARIINIIGGAIGLSALFLVEYNYQIPIYCSVLFFPICIVVLRLYKGIIKIDVHKNSAYPSIMIALMSTSGGLLMRALFDFNLLKIDSVFSIITIITLLLVALYLVKRKALENGKNLIFFIFFIILSYAYSYGSFVILNCMYDNDIETYTSRVLNKRSSRGKTTSYYLELNNWAKNDKITETNVSMDFYNKTEVNDFITLTYGKGFFNVPWYKINE